MSNANFLWILEIVNRKLARRGWAGLGSEMDGAWGRCWWVGRPVQGRGSIGAMIGGRGLGTTSELIIALPAQPPQPTAYITTVAVSVRSIDILV